MKKILFAHVLLVMTFFFTSFAKASITDCEPGYKFNRNSGVGCQQENCYDIPNAHYSYTGACICGTSGSINEKPTDPNKSCAYDNSNTSCPGCVYACIHFEEECPGQQTNPEPIPEPIEPSPANNTILNPEPDQVRIPDVTPIDISGVGNLAQPATAPATGPTCEKFCAKLTRGGIFDEVLVATGIYPNCNCTVDNKDENNHLTETVTQNGDTRTTYTYNPTTGALIKKNTISMLAERERIRQALGFKYDEEQIDALLDDEKINQWFSDRMNNIETNASFFTPAFWWQHMVALWDHGYGNSADFVDTYNFGRCGDSMEWLENNLAGELKLTENNSEAMLSITGEKYGNLINHTALIIRPNGYSNIEWGDAVQELMDKTRSGGLTKNDILNLDPKLLDAKVLDPYFKKTTTVREFIKGWSVIKIS